MRYRMLAATAAVVASALYVTPAAVLPRAAIAADCDARVSAPADLQSRLNAAGAGARVCLSGTFAGDIHPLARQTILGGKLVGTYDLHAGYVTLRDVEVDGASRGVIMGPHAWVDASYIHDSVETGISAYAGNADWYLRITGNRLVDNGSRSFEGHSAAGMKLLNLSRPNRPLGAGATVTDNVVVGSSGNGIWLDQSANASTIANNTIRNSTRHGIRCEICGGPIAIRGNVIDASGYDGIDVTSTGVATLSGNVVTGSGDWGITVHGDWRAQKTWPNLGDPHVGWHLHSIVLSGNRADRTNGCALAAVKC